MYNIMKTENTLPCDPTAISSLEEERLRHDAQWGKAIFLIICGWKKEAYMTLCQVRNAFMKILSVQKKNKKNKTHSGACEQVVGRLRGTCFFTRL